MLVLTFIVALLSILIGPIGSAQQQPQDYFPPEVLDRPLGIERLPNGNTLLTDGGGAYYTTTDASIMEVSPAGELVWLHVGQMAFPHSAVRLPNGDTLISDTSNDRVFRVNAAGEIVWSSDDWGGDSGALSDGSHLHYPNDAQLLEDAQSLGDSHLLITDRNNEGPHRVDLRPAYPAPQWRPPAKWSHHDRQFGGESGHRSEHGGRDHLVLRRG
jgi:hypothetical protein